MKDILGDFKRHLTRLFKATTEDSSNVGKVNHQSSKTWLKWYAKYREPCIRFIALKRPQWKNEAEDVVQRVAAKIAGDPYITDRGKDDSYRTVICNMCLTELSHMHSPHRAAAVRRYNRLNAGQDASCHMTKTQAEERMLEFTRIQRNNLLDKNYDVEKYYPNIRIGKLAQKELDAQISMLRSEGLVSKYVFPQVDGGLITQRQYRDAWHKFCEHNGISHITPYELRHTFVSVNDDMPDGLKKYVMGHSESMDTEGVYGHEKDGNLKRISDDIF